MNIVFTEEQQAHIDGLIKKKYAEAHAKAEAKAAGELTAAESKHTEELNTLKGQLDKLQAAQGENNDRIRRALLKAEIAGSEAVKPDQLMKLLDGDFTLGNDGDLRVVDDKGVARLDEAGNPLSVKTFLEGFLKDNPHLRKSSGTRGSGSTSAIGFDGLVRAVNTMRRSDFDGLSAQAKQNFLMTGGKPVD